MIFFSLRFCFVFTKYWFIERCVTLNWHIDISRNCGYCFEKYNPTLTDSYHYLEPLLRVSETSLINNESESYWGEQQRGAAQGSADTGWFLLAVTSRSAGVTRRGGDGDSQGWVINSVTNYLPESLTAQGITGLTLLSSQSPPEHQTQMQEMHLNLEYFSRNLNSLIPRFPWLYYLTAGKKFHTGLHLICSFTGSNWQPRYKKRRNRVGSEELHKAEAHPPNRGLTWILGRASQVSREL